MAKQWCPFSDYGPCSQSPWWHHTNVIDLDIFYLWIKVSTQSILAKREVIRMMQFWNHFTPLKAVMHMHCTIILAWLVFFTICKEGMIQISQLLLTFLSEDSYNSKLFICSSHMWTVGQTWPSRMFYKYMWLKLLFSVSFLQKKMRTPHALTGASGSRYFDDGPSRHLLRQKTISYHLEKMLT